MYFSFPTINWYENGKLVEEYPNDRKEDQLFDFVDSWSQPETEMEGWLARQEILDKLEEEKQKKKRAKKLQQNKNDL